MSWYVCSHPRKTNSFLECESSIDTERLSGLGARLLTSGTVHGFFSSLGGRIPRPSSPVSTHFVRETVEGSLAVQVVDPHLRQRFRNMWVHHFLLVQ
jgi:hypothetical protein